MIQLEINWKVNTILGFTVFLFTCFTSLINNTWQTSLFRAGVGFLLFFLFGYVLRFVMQLISTMKNTEELVSTQILAEESSPVIESIDPSEDVIADETAFKVLPLHALHNGKEEK